MALKHSCLHGGDCVGQRPVALQIHAGSSRVSSRPYSEVTCCTCEACGIHTLLSRAAITVSHLQLSSEFAAIPLPFRCWWRGDFSAGKSFSIRSGSWILAAARAWLDCARPSSERMQYSQICKPSARGSHVHTSNCSVHACCVCTFAEHAHTVNNTIGIQTGMPVWKERAPGIAVD